MYVELNTQEKQDISSIVIGTTGIFVKISFTEISQFIKIITGITITDHKTATIKSKNRTRLKIANLLCETISPAILNAFIGYVPGIVTMIIAKKDPITQKIEIENKRSIAAKNSICSIPSERKLVVLAAEPTIVARNAGIN